MFRLLLGASSFIVAAGAAASTACLPSSENSPTNDAVLARDGSEGLSGSVEHRAFVPALSKAPPPRRLVVAAVGDVSLAREINRRMAESGPGFPFEQVTELLDADITVGNLEGALTSGGTRWPKAYNFFTPPELAGGLKTAGFDVLALANNHAMDFGPEGLLDTVRTLDALGIGRAGAGATLQEARRPAIVASGGLRVAFLSFALTPPEWTGFSICSWQASDGAPGIAVGSPSDIADAVALAAAESDFVVVFLHAGTEYAAAVDGTQHRLVEAALGAGAAAVLGSHSHVVQPLSWAGPGQPLVAWGLGNFVFDFDDDDLSNIPEPRVSPILHVTFEEGSGVVEWRADAVTQNIEEDRPYPATAPEQAVLDSDLALWPEPLAASASCP